MSNGGGTCLEGSVVFYFCNLVGDCSVKRGGDLLIDDF